MLTILSGFSQNVICIFCREIEMLYLNTIKQLFLFVEQLDQLEVCLPLSRLLTGIPILAVFQNLRWYSIKTSLFKYQKGSVLMKTRWQLLFLLYPSWSKSTYEVDRNAFVIISHKLDKHYVGYKTEAVIMFPGYFTWQVYSRNYLDPYLFFLFVLSCVGRKRPK